MSAILWVGSGAEHVGADLARLSRLPQAHVRRQTFADGEFCVRVEATATAPTVVILQSLYPSQHRRLHELYQLVDVAAAQGASRIVCVVPYLAYARQDRRAAVGEPLSCAIVVRTLASLGATDLLCVDAHNPAALACAGIEAQSISPATIFAAWIERLDLRRPLIVSPDEGGRERVESVGGLAGIPAVTLSKRRDDDGELTFGGALEELAGHDVVVIDDICSTGATFGRLVRSLRDLPATLAYGVTHLLADARAVQDAAARPVELQSTDTVPGCGPRASIAPVIAGRLAADGIAGPPSGRVRAS